jgi:hypothetical protein
MLVTIAAVLAIGAAIVVGLTYSILPKCAYCKRLLKSMCAATKGGLYCTVKCAMRDNPTVLPYEVEIIQTEDIL